MARKQDDDDDVSSANEAMGEEFKRALAEEKGEVAKREPKAAKDVDVDEENDEEQEREPQEERASRAERRRARRSAFEEAQRERDEYRRQFEESQRSIAEMRGQLQVLTSQRKDPAEQPQKSVEELSLEQAEQAVYNIHNEFSSLPPAEQQSRLAEFQRKHTEAERKKDEARYRLFQSKNQPPQQRAPSQAEMYLNAQAPDVMSQGQRGLIAVQTHHARLTQLRGEPDSLATLAKAVELAREDLGLRRNAPSINQREPGLRAKLAAPSGPQGGSGGDERGRRVVRMGGNSQEERDRRKMAQAMYPKLPPEKAYERFAKTVLKEQLEDGEIDS